METILVVNAGSSSLKFQVFALGILPDLKCLVKGQRPDSRVALYAIPHRRGTDDRAPYAFRAVARCRCCTTTLCFMNRAVTERLGC